jgi:hypothetical protein
MLQKLFGGGQRKQAPVAVNPQSTSRTVNAIDKLGEVWPLSPGGRCRPLLASRPPQRAGPTGARLASQTEGLLVKRRDLLEKKIAQELEKAKQCLQQKNKRGAGSRAER